MSKVFAGYHVVFATKCRKQSITYSERRRLYGYIHETLSSNNCFTLRINGMRDHIHIAFNLHPSVALADLIRTLKIYSSKWLSADPAFPLFDGWGNGYYANTFSYEDRASVIEYIKNQEQHHIGTGLITEMEWFAMKAGLKWHPDDWT